jgi:hypothetical protein
MIGFVPVEGRQKPNLAPIQVILSRSVATIEQRAALSIQNTFNDLFVSGLGRSQVKFPDSTFQKVMSIHVDPGKLALP